MRVWGLGELRRAAQWLRGRFAPRALILLYHRVAEVTSDPQLLCVTPGHFSEHLEILRKHSHLMQVLQLTRTLQDEDLPRRTVVITFDDGYADNLYNAKPLLERYDVPATVFVATGYLGQEREFWWDELEGLLLQPGILPEILEMKRNGKTLKFTLGEAASYSEERYRCYQGWHMEMKDDPSPRHRVYRSLCMLLRELPGRDLRKKLDELQAWAGRETKIRPTHCTISTDELLNLAEGGLLEVGAHTKTHPILSLLTAEEQLVEVQGSKTKLEEILGRSVQGFAYPYGLQSDYTADTSAIVQQAGFKLACANFSGMVWRGTDCFQLPRVLVRDWDGEEFSRQLGRWFSV